MKKFIAHIIIEAKTPLKVGSGDSDFIQDSIIQKDWNNLPMILGSSIAGVIRKEFDEIKANEIFGKDEGSKVIISNALLLDEHRKVNETLLLEKSHFLTIFNNLPIREHTAINEKGVAKEHSKFDEEVLFKGTRFKFSIESITTKEEFEEVLNTLYLKTFRIGSGSTKGFGKIEVIEIKTAELSIDSDEYRNYSSSLNYELKTNFTPTKKEENLTHYKLSLKPDDFFMFGSGFGDEDADMTPVYEEVVDYNTKSLSRRKLIIPASSLKGAISHRAIFYYNKLKENYIVENGENEILNPIEVLGEKKDTKIASGQKGKIYLEDLFLEKEDTKVFDHVAIDRYTGGAIDGALFQEKTATYKDEFEIDIYLKEIEDEVQKEAFELALKDITTGMLSLGGATTKGHGIFRGKLFINGEEK
jgi:CRISPR/Cas system CSM-associated protein Csm3 (group 7 of RAMP superfamily)